MQIFVTLEEKVLLLGKFSAVATGGQGGTCPPSWFTKNTVFGASCKGKKTDNDAKRNNNIQSYLLDQSYQH